MKTKYLLLFVIILSSFNFLFPQSVIKSGAYMCSQKRMKASNHYLFNNDSPNTPKHKFDVQNYKLNLDIRSCFLSPYPHSYTATEIITFRVDTALNSITLNAISTSLQINAVSLKGVSFTHSADILTITLDSTYNPGRGELVAYIQSFRNDN